MGGQGQVTFPWRAIIAAILAFLVAGSFKIGDLWEKAVVLRLGRYTGLCRPGPFFITPFAVQVVYSTDHCNITIPFRAEKTPAENRPGNNDRYLISTPQGRLPGVTPGFFPRHPGILSFTVVGADRRNNPGRVPVPSRDWHGIFLKEPCHLLSSNPVHLHLPGGCDPFHQQGVRSRGTPNRP